ncbi:MAG: cell wall-binding protein [Lachnospiraceae bacterium]
MSYIKRAMSTMLILALLMSLTALPAFAASRKKINSISINITANIKPETKYGDEEVDIDVKSGKCSFDYYEIENVGFEWMEDDVPELTLYFAADEGYYFALGKASSIKMTGATYVSASKQDSSETLVMKVKLSSLAETVGDDTEVTLHTSGYAVWSEARGAGSYELRLYRNGVGVGASYLTTTDTHYDFRSMMNRTGSYSVKVRPVNKLVTDNKGTWTESAVITLDQDMVNAIKNGEAGGMPVYITGDWVKDDNGWWYRHSDDSYTSNNWEEIDSKWFFFDETGYMQTGWIDWNDQKYYCSETNGAMLRNTTTPDGYMVGEDGTRVNSR